MMPFNAAALSQQISAAAAAANHADEEDDDYASASRSWADENIVQQTLAAASFLPRVLPNAPPMDPTMDLRRIFAPQMPYPSLLLNNMQQLQDVLLAGGGPMQGMPNIYIDPTMGFHPYMDGSRRKNATRETTLPLKDWLNKHRKNPYPSKGEKVMLAMMTKMTLTQVSTWFANARRRLKKENRWSPQERREDGEDDDLERPSSSNTNNSVDKEDLDVSIDSNKNLKPKLEGEGDEIPSTPKKRGIWSIADTIDVATKDDVKVGDDEKKEMSGNLMNQCAIQQQMFSMCRQFSPLMAKMMMSTPSMYAPFMMTLGQQTPQNATEMADSVSPTVSSSSSESSEPPKKECKEEPSESPPTLKLASVS